jgi:hypothetical protein
LNRLQNWGSFYENSFHSAEPAIKETKKVQWIVY